MIYGHNIDDKKEKHMNMIQLPENVILDLDEVQAFKLETYNRRSGTYGGKVLFKGGSSLFLRERTARGLKKAIDQAYPARVVIEVSEHVEE